MRPKSIDLALIVSILLTEDSILGSQPNPKTDSVG
jgi:hypothetical protein